MFLNVPSLPILELSHVCAATVLLGIAGLSDESGRWWISGGINGAHFPVADASSPNLDDAEPGPDRRPEPSRRLEDHLQRQTREIVGELASGVAHDFNIILTAILNNVDLLRMRTTSRDPRRNNIEEIRDAVSRGVGLAQQLTSFNRRRAIQPTPVALNRTIEEMMPLMRRLIGSKVRLQCTLAPDAPVIVADRTQVEQLLLNLVMNARDAMAGVGQLTIETASVCVAADQEGSALAPGSYVQLTVADTGCGMSAAVKARLFDPFFTSKKDGVGLGMSTVRGIVTRHGGVIEVDSTEDEGTTFRVFLPSDGADA